MNLVRENIDFRRGGDPKRAIGIGKHILKIEWGVKKYGPTFRIFYDTWLEAERLKELGELDNLTDIIYTGDVKNTPDPLPEPFFDFQKSKNRSAEKNRNLKYGVYKWRAYLPIQEFPKPGILIFPEWKIKEYILTSSIKLGDIIQDIP